MSERRVKRIEFSDVFLPILMGAGEHHYTASPPLPADTRVIDVRWGNWSFVLFIESQEFDPIPADSEPPLLDLRFTKIPPR